MKKSGGIYLLTAPDGSKYVGLAKELIVRKRKFYSESLYTSKLGREKTLIDKKREEYPDLSKWTYKVLFSRKYSLEEKDEVLIELSELEVHFIEKEGTFRTEKGLNSTRGGSGLDALKGIKSQVLVDQYLDDVLIKTWPSITDAASELGIASTNISDCCSGGLKSAGGFVWKFTNPDIAGRRKSTKTQVPVDQYLDDVLIKTWPSITDAASELGIASTSISACCSGRQKSAGGFVWKRSEGCRE